MRVSPSLLCTPVAAPDLSILDWLRQVEAPVVTNPLRTITVADLFCGCGGMTLGAIEAARVNQCETEVRVAADYARHALEVYLQNLPIANNSTVFHQDMGEVFVDKLGQKLSKTETKIRDANRHIDLLLAGPPCQGHSDLNNRTRRNDPRNALYRLAIRAVEVLKPRAVIIENVPTVIHDKAGVVFESDNYLRHIGYYVSHAVVNAADFGLCQRRRRHLLVATKIEHSSEVLRTSQSPTATLRQYIEDLVDEDQYETSIFNTASRMRSANRERASYLFANDLYDLPNNLRPSCHRDKTHSYVSMYGRMHWDKPAQTLTSGFGSMGQGRYLHPARCRTITPHEAARIQGFPDFFSFAGVQKRTQLQEIIANAVPPLLVAAIVHRLLDEGCL